MTGLKPCPFCGGRNIERIDSFGIGCHDCLIVVKLWGWNELDADIQGVWNRRDPGA